jgi:putative oxidoreductase
MLRADFQRPTIGLAKERQHIRSMENQLNYEMVGAPFAPRVLSIARIMIGLLLLQHPTAKFFGFPHVAMFDNLKVASLVGTAGMIELIGGVLFILGLFTRPVAFILSGLLAFAYFIGHAPRGFYPMTNSGEAAVLFCFIFLYYACAGGGRWSLDAMLRRKA